MGPLISADQRETVASYVAGRRAGRDPRQRARRARASGSRRRCCARSRTTTAPRARRSSARSPCVIPFRDEEEAVAARQRHDLRPVGLDLDARRRARRCASRARSRPACSRSTRTPRCGCRRRSAASSSPASGRELGPDALEHYTEREERLLRDGGADGGRLEGKVCVITGAASGIGAETARLFERGGREGRGRGPQPRTRTATSRIQADVTDEEQVRGHVRAGARASSAASTCCSTTPGINPTDDASVLDTSLEAWQRVQDVNLEVVFLCCKHGIPHLLDGGGGSVINTASFVAVMGAAVSQISYTASKGGVLALSRELGVEFARRGVRVNALCPGPVNTPLLQELFAKDPEKAARRLVHLPMGRFAEAREIANGGAVPGQRRVVLRDRLDLPGRRRPLGRLRHARVRVLLGRPRAGRGRRRVRRASRRGCRRSRAAPGLERRRRVS